MQVPRIAERCIVCLKKPPFPDGYPFSEEHVIPRALGGILTSEFLCKTCNDGFGHSFEARAKTDPAVRSAIHNLQTQLPALYATIEEGQPYQINTKVGALSGTVRDGEIVGGTRKLGDDSILTSERDTRPRLRDILRKRGHGPEYVNEALKRLDDGPQELEFEIAPGLSVVKRVATASPDLSKGVPVDPLVCLKIAYEFAALLFGPPVLADNPALNEMRRALLEKDATSPVFRVDSLIAKEYAGFHGIAFEGNDPYAKIQIRLFGRLAYRVHLLNLSFNSEPVTYTHDLVAKTDSLARTNFAG